MSKQQSLELYFTTWNERKDEARGKLLASCFAQNGRYLDPHVPNQTNSIDEMDDIIKLFQSRLPHRLVALKKAEFHHHVFRVRWKMDDKGKVLSEGTFVGEFDLNDRITNLICFIDS